MRRPALALFLVAAVLGVTVGLAEGMGASARTPVVAPGAISTPLVGARLVCPDVADRTEGHIARVTRVGVGLPPAASTPASADTGAVTAVPLGTRTPRAALLRAPGTARIVDGRPAYQGDLIVTATDSAAPGVAADEFGRRDGGTYRGLDSVACTSPRDDGWLVGASTVVGAHAELRLTNIDDEAALVDIGLFGTKGLVNASNSTGLSVAPHKTRSIKLETLAPAQSLLLVHVAARAGRVAVALRQQSQNASTPQGQDWLPLAGPPATSSVVPGLASGGGPRRVLLGNPGLTDATATVRLVRTDSAFVPRGLANVTVPAGSVVALDVTSGLGGKAGAAIVTADHPVVAAAAMSTGQSSISGFAEQAFSATSTPLVDPATAVANFVRARTSMLVLTAPTRAADVRITTLVGVGPGGGHTTTVHVAGGRTRVVDLGGLVKDATFVAVTVTPVPGGGAVYAAREEYEVGSHGPMFTVMPLQSSPTTAQVPATAADLRAGLPN